jgi:serine protease Do
MKRTALYSSLIGTIAGVALATGVFWQSNHMSAAPQVVMAQERAMPTSYAGVLRPILPAVVNISTTRIIKTQAQQLPPGMEDFFGGMFGQRGRGRFQVPPEERRSGGTGSGVIVSHDGYILTNNHVIDGAKDVTVTLTDKREFQAKVVGTDPWADIAVVKISAGSALPVVPIADSGHAQVGDIVFAIGSPMGLKSTVTMGIVSATGRANLGIERFEDFIQTDAAINPGNSGGALVNAAGQLVGINTAILSGSGGNQGIGFAIPSTMARDVMDQLVKNGKVRRGYIGVGVQEVTPSLAEAFKAPIGSVAITQVQPDTPGAKAGIQVGDIVTKINGEEVNDVNAFRNRVARNAPGTTITLTVNRSGKVEQLPVTLGELPGQDGDKDNEGSEQGSTVRPLDGVDVQALTPDIARQLQIPPTTKGVVVSQVDPSSAAAAAGLQEGDVIQQVNRQAVTSVGDFSRLVRESKGTTVLLVNRGGGSVFIAIENKAK